MYHYVNAITNTKGDALIGYYVQLTNPSTGDVVPIYADNNSTPIVSVSGVENKAKVDSNGNASFYVVGGEYDLNIYATNASSLVESAFNIPMIDIASVANVVSDRLVLSARSAADEDVCLLTEDGYFGYLKFDDSDLSGAVALDTNQYQYVAPDSDDTGASGAWVRQMLTAFPIACSDETTALTTGTAKVSFRMPGAFTVIGVRGSLVTAQASGSILTVDINVSGSSILSTKLTFDNTEKTTTTATTPAVISSAEIADDAEITVDIDQIGNGTATGLKVYLIGYYQ